MSDIYPLPKGFDLRSKNLKHCRRNISCIRWRWANTCGPTSDSVRCIRLDVLLGIRLLDPYMIFVIFSPEANFSGNGWIFLQRRCPQQISGPIGSTLSCADQLFFECFAGALLWSYSRWFNIMSSKFDKAWYTAGVGGGIILLCGGLCPKIGVTP